MRFLLVTWDGGGNVPPTLAIARRLVDRGHLVLAFESLELIERSVVFGTGAIG